MNCISYNKNSVSRLQLINNAFIPRNKAKQFLLKQFTTSKNISVLYFFLHLNIIFMNVKL